MPRIVLTLLVTGLIVYTLVDIAGAREDELRGLPKWLWVILVIFLPVAGSLAWLVVRASARRGGPAPRPARGPSGVPGPRPTPGRRPDAPVAPDDDPEFLWLLEQARRKREREAAQASGVPADDDAPGRPADRPSDVPTTERPSDRADEPRDADGQSPE